MTAAVALLGAVIGSFLNVVSHRVPRHESLVRPGSHCPACGHPIRPWHNIPIVGWLLLRGLCADCHGRIPARYPLVELATALLFGAVVARYGLHADALVPLVLVSFLVPIALIDLELRIIPNRLTAAAALVAVPLVALIDPASAPERLIAAAAAGGAFLLVALAAPAGMGMGDVKLVAVLGLYLGAEVAVAVLVALVAGTVIGLAIMARRGVRRGRRTAIPFGPFLALGGVVAVFAGSSLLDLYLHAF